MKKNMNIDSTRALFEYSALMVDEINQGKNVSRELRDLQLITYAGLLNYYGVGFASDIEKTFRAIKFHSTGNQVLSEYMEDYGIADFATCSAIERTGASSYLIDKAKKNILFPGISRDLYVTEHEGVPFEKKVKDFAGNVNAVLNSINKPLCIVGGVVTRRKGLKVTTWDLPNEGRRVFYNTAIEDYFGSIQDEDLFAKIQQLANEDMLMEDARRISQRLREETMDEDDYDLRGRASCCLQVTNSLKKLYFDPVFGLTLVKSRISGKIGDVKKEFNRGCEHDVYAMLDSSCMALWKIDGTVEKEADRIERYVQSYMKRRGK